MAMGWLVRITILTVGAVVIPIGYAHAELEYTPPNIDEILTPGNIHKLKAGKILRFSQKTIQVNGSSVGGGYVVGIIDREPEAVWAVLTDFEKQPEYMPRLRKVQLGERQGQIVPVTHTIKVLTRNVSYSLIQTLDEQSHALTWRIDDKKENDILETVGSWQLKPYQSGQCLAVYSVLVNTGTRIPNFLEHFLIRRDMPDVVGALRKRVESNGAYTKLR